MTSNISRRQFLRAEFKGRPDAIRPPGALDEAGFAAASTRCSACMEACPEGIIKQDNRGYPVLDFNVGGCTFCGDCVTACEPRALRCQAGTAPSLSVSVSITEKCLANRDIDCRICDDACEARAIHFRPAPGGISRPAIDPGSCTGCGFCLAICPTEAITIKNLPLRQEDKSCQLSISPAC